MVEVVAEAAVRYSSLDHSAVATAEVSEAEVSVGAAEVQAEEEAQDEAGNRLGVWYAKLYIVHTIRFSITLKAYQNFRGV